MFKILQYLINNCCQSENRKNKIELYVKRRENIMNENMSL